MPKHNQSIVHWMQNEHDQLFDEILRARREKGVTLFNMAVEIKSNADVRISPSEATHANKKLFPPERQRTIISSDRLFTPRFNAAFNDWLQRRGHTPPTQEQIDGAQLSLLSQTAQREEETDEPRERRTRAPRNALKDDQWQMIADDLIRLHPITMKSSTLIGISFDDVFQSARRLFPTQRMPKFVIGAARIKLLECVQYANARKQEQPVQQVVASTADILMQGFAAEIAKGLMPAMQMLMASQMAAMKAEMQIMLRSMLADEMRNTGAHKPGGAATSRSKKIAVIGGYTAPAMLQTKLGTKYPQFKFVMMGRDPRNIADHVAQCDLVLCNVDGISHSTAAAARRAVPETRFKQVAGGDKALYHALDVFQVQQNEIENQNNGN